MSDHPLIVHYSASIDENVTCSFAHTAMELDEHIAGNSVVKCRHLFYIIHIALLYKGSCAYIANNIILLVFYFYPFFANYLTILVSVVETSMISSTPLRQRPESLRQRYADVDRRSPLNTSFEQAVALHQLVLPSLDKFSTIAAKEKAQSQDFEQFLFSVLEETNVSSTPGKTSAKSTPQRSVRF